MKVTAEFEEISGMRLREQVAEGEFGDRKFNITRSLNGMFYYVELEDSKFSLSIHDLIRKFLEQLSDQESEANE